MKERQEKSDQESKQFKEDMKKELNKFRGIWSNAWGDFVETLFSGRFVELIQDWIPSIKQIIKKQYLSTVKGMNGKWILLLSIVIL